MPVKSWWHRLTALRGYSGTQNGIQGVSLSLLDLETRKALQLPVARQFRLRLVNPEVAPPIELPRLSQWSGRMSKESWTIIPGWLGTAGKVGESYRVRTGRDRTRGRLQPIRTASCDCQRGRRYIVRVVGDIGIEDVCPRGRRPGTGEKSENLSRSRRPSPPRAGLESTRRWFHRLHLHRRLSNC